MKVDQVCDVIIDTLMDEEYIESAYIDVNAMNHSIEVTGTFQKFNDRMDFAIRITDEAIEELSEMGDSLIADYALSHAQKNVRKHTKAWSGELNGVPLQILEVGGYSVQCYNCGDRSHIPMESIVEHDVSRKAAFHACLARLHTGRGNEACRPIYVRCAKS